MSTQSNVVVKGNWYNGYSPIERDKKFKVLKELLAMGLLPPACGPCALCGDPFSPVEYHSEDYGEPFLWLPPAMYCLCRGCHRQRLHRRFWQKSLWLTFLGHVRRGGYSSDLKLEDIRYELSTYHQSIKQGQKITLKQLRPYQNIAGQEWFANLRIDSFSLNDSNARLVRAK